MRIRSKPVSASERQEMWTRWRAGDSISGIANTLGRRVSVVWAHLLRTGGIKPHVRRRNPRQLSEADREEISRGVVLGRSVRAIARAIGRCPSTVSREIRRNGGRSNYRMVDAEQRAQTQAKRPKLCKLARSGKLRRVVARRLSEDWSPGQIAGWLRREYPNTAAMNISHETIYRSLFIQARNVLKAELRDHLRSQQRMRKGRGTRGQKHEARIEDAVSIRERPAEADDRAVPGHWEGDLLMGTPSSCIVTLVERTTRYVLLAKVDGKSTSDVVPALIKAIRRLPEELRRSLTWDRGKELAAHKEFTVATDVAVYFCDPSSPWQRGSNENTNGLLRQYFPKGEDVSHYTQPQLNAVAKRLNQRPRQTLQFRSPAEALNELLR